MKRSARLEKIADINLGFENIAGATLEASRALFMKQKQQLEQLEIYKQEYQKQLKTRLKDVISAREIQDYQYFFSSLDNAITQQEKIVIESSMDVEKSQENWLSKKQDHKKISRASENSKIQEDIDRLKNEQKESDEINLNIFAMKKKPFETSK